MNAVERYKYKPERMKLFSTTTLEDMVRKVNRFIDNIANINIITFWLERYDKPTLEYMGVLKFSAYELIP